jgi:hypothetical protein
MTLCRILTATLLLALTACSGITVTNDYDPQADFSPLRTYSWLRPPSRESIR